MHSSNSAHLCVMLNSSLVMCLRNVKQKKNTYATQRQQLSAEINIGSINKPRSHRISQVVGSPWLCGTSYIV